MPLVRLIFNPNEDDEQFFELAALRLTVGTADDTDITCSHPSLSPRHFKLEQRDDGWHLIDLRSKSGTFVRDEQIDVIRDYLFPGVQSGPMATIIAGVIGTLLLFLMTVGLGRVLVRRGTEG